MTALGGFDDTGDMPLRSSAPAAAPSSVAADTSAADKAALVQCQAELSSCREDLLACRADLSKEKAENSSLKAALEAASSKIAVLEEAQAAAKAKVEAAAKDFGALPFCLVAAVDRSFCGHLESSSSRSKTL
jgi:septal ring factor EnvC (AmiA/AmiB activator)